MSRFDLKTLTRDSFIVEFDSKEYKVDGERGGNGVWEIFPRMVYRRISADRSELVEDHALRAAIVAALIENWDDYGFEYTLKLIED